MTWLREHRSERRKRQASGVLLVVGLLLGVVAVAPAFADDGPTRPATRATDEPTPHRSADGFPLTVAGVSLLGSAGLALSAGADRRRRLTDG